jgi:hypothetical protein
VFVLLNRPYKVKHTAVRRIYVYLPLSRVWLWCLFSGLGLGIRDGFIGRRKHKNKSSATRSMFFTLGQPRLEV